MFIQLEMLALKPVRDDMYDDVLQMVQHIMCRLYLYRITSIVITHFRTIS